MIGHLDPGQIQALADVVGPGGIHDHGPEAGGDALFQLVDGHKPGPVLIGPGKMTDQILQRMDIQRRKLLGLCRADAF